MSHDRTLSGYNTLVKAVSLVMRIYDPEEQDTVTFLAQDVYYLQHYHNMAQWCLSKGYGVLFDSYCAAYDARVRLIQNRGYLNQGNLLKGE